MGERPDDLRREPLGEDGLALDPVARETGFDPATDAFDPDAIDRRPEALRDDTGVDEVATTRAEIERTRADMSETVDAIQERLSPENLKEQAKDRVKEATVGRAQEAGSGIMETIRANPVPAALTGIGLGWLLVSARRSGSRQRRYYPDRAPAYGYAPSYEDRSTSDTPVPSPGEALGRARDRVGESATQTQERAGEVASQAQDRLSNLPHQVRYQAQRASSTFQRMLRENPLTVGALALGAGAAVGLAIPESTKEHEVMGEARDTLVEKAQEKAQEAQEKVQRVAQEAQSAAKEEAENQGLTDQ
jgi:ElaB/YqjD/DUF883 family membrane-anchored ribosome-binding protein